MKSIFGYLKNKVTKVFEDEQLIQIQISQFTPELSAYFSMQCLFSSTIAPNTIIYSYSRCSLAHCIPKTGWKLKRLMRTRQIIGAINQVNMVSCCDSSALTMTYMDGPFSLRIQLPLLNAAFVQYVLNCIKWFTSFGWESRSKRNEAVLLIRIH